MYRRIAAVTAAILLLATAGALAAAPRGGQYKGSNAQHESVSFTVTGTTVSGFRYQVRPTCRALGQTLPDSGDAPTVTLEPFALKGSRIKVHQVQEDPANSATTTTDVVATVKGGVVSGYTQDTVRAVGSGIAITCSTPKVRFSARHV